MRWAFATVVVLAALAWGASPHRGLPGPVPASAHDTVFSSARAMSHVVEIARLPRPTGSAEHDRVRSYLLARLRSLGVETDTQTTTSYLGEPGSDHALSATVRNVVARIPGTASGASVALVAHYDAAPSSPGAAGGAFGVATVLEAFRALAAGPAPRHDVIVAFTDGEALGGLGIQAFVARHPWARTVRVAITAGAFAGAGPVAVVETNPNDGALLEGFERGGLRPLPSAAARTLVTSGALSDALAPFLESGAQVVRFVALGDRGGLGQPWDTPDRVREESLQHAGLQLVAAVRGFADEGPVDSSASQDGNRVYFSLPGVGVVHYPSRWVLPTSLALLVAFALVGLLLRSRRASWWGMGVGVVVGLVAIGLSAVSGGVFLDVVSVRHPEFGSVQGALYREGTHLLALVGLALACVTTSFIVPRRRFRADETSFGALLVPLAACLWLTLREPLAAPALQWPLAAALCGVAGIGLLGARRGVGPWGWLLLLPAAALVVVLGEPGLEVAARAWTFTEARRLAALFALGLLLLLPFLEWALRPMAWPLPVASVGVALALAGLALPAVRGGVDHPMQTSLVYLTERPVRNVLSGAGDVPAPPDRAVARHMSGDWLTLRGRDERWARSWVAEGATGPRDPGVLMLPGAAQEAYEVAGGGPDAELFAPVARVLSSEVEGGRRRLTVAVRSGLRGEMLGLRVPDGSDAMLSGVEGARFPTPVRSLSHWGVPASGEVTVDVVLGAETAALDLLVIEHHLRPREILGDYFFQRPDSLVANASMGSDRVIQRTRLRVPAWGGATRAAGPVRAEPQAGS